MSYRKDIDDILDEIESDLQDVYNDLEEIKGISEIDNIKTIVSTILQKFK